MKSQIVNLKIDHRHIYKLLYKVIWLECEIIEEKSNWLSILELVHATNLIFDFHQASFNCSIFPWT